MDILHQIEINIILFIQSIGTWLALPMEAVTSLGYEEFYMLIMPALYWCVNAAFGFRMAIMLLLSNTFSSTFKLLFHQPRPYWLDTRVTAFTAETSFGLPSGHSLNAAAVWGILAASVRQKWVKIVVIVTIFLIGFSRLYLGVHFISDVLMGWLIGGLILWGFLALEKPLVSWLRARSLNQMALLALGSSLLLILLVLIPRALLPGWQVPDLWRENALAGYPDNVIDPLNIEGAFTVAGTWFGMTLGVAWLFHRQGGFDASGTWVQRTLRYGIGVVGVAIFWFGLGLVFPDGANVLSYLLRFFRYSLVGLWVSALAPLLFERLGLAKGPAKGIPAYSTR